MDNRYSNIIVKLEIDVIFCVTKIISLFIEQIYLSDSVFYRIIHGTFILLLFHLAREFFSSIRIDGLVGT